MSLTVGILKAALKGLDEDLLVVIGVEDGAYTPACSANISVEDINFGGVVEECLLLNPCDCEDEDLTRLN